LSRLIVGSIAILGAAAGCNAVLGNEEGTPRVPLEAGADAGSDAPAAIPGGTDASSAARDAAPDADACADACANEGETRCHGAGIQTCVKVDASCTHWSEAAACDAKLTCDPRGSVCACEAYYVEAGLDRGAAVPCTFPTITLALEAAKKTMPVSRVIHVGAGTFDAAHGEVFPLVLRGLSLVGAGEATTKIVGTGAFDHTYRRGAFAGTYDVAVVIGDAHLATRVSQLSIAAPTAGRQGIGVYCDEGDAAAQPNVPSPNTSIDEVTIGPKFDLALLAATTTGDITAGCNVKVTGSHITDANLGVWVLGCGTNASAAPVAIELGGAAEGEGNVFSGIQGPNNDARAIMKWDCVTSMKIVRNTFQSTDWGVELIGGGMNNVFDVIGNRFDGLTNTGLQLTKNAMIRELRGNVFTGIATPAAWEAPGVALRLKGDGMVADEAPWVAKARDNQFVGNDVAIELRGEPVGAKGGTLTTMDFGRPDDHGHNLFQCNSTLSGRKARGGDVVVNVASSGAVLGFAGNTWDHAPPTADSLAAGINGVDLLRATNAPAVDVSVSEATDGSCPAGRVR
jgi:hypothetical protein